MAPISTGVQAVRTTGIYCRPECSARPHPANVERYPVAAAAEAAGYRACLRCRPYRDDRPPALDGPELVCRAVALVVDGALDGGGTEDQLAARVGASARHLRRLFVRHIGVTPDQLARSRRAHFARRLLDDTDLRLTDVAMAAGFGSVRQLHRACREVFRATPTELRARRRRSDRLAADGGLDLRLPLPRPFELDALFDWLSRRAVSGVEVVIADPSVAAWAPLYRRTAVIDGHPGVIELFGGAVVTDADHLRLRVHLPAWDGLIHVVGHLRHLLALDAPAASQLDVLVEDPLLAPLVAAHPGTRAPGAWDPLEAAVRAVVGQQVSVAAATRVLGRIAARHGTPVAGLEAMGLSHVFPDADTLAGADLDGLGLTGTKVRAVGELAAAMAGGHLRLDRSVTLVEMVEALTALHGIGPWTAEYLALRLGEPDAFPAGDLGLREAVARATGGPRPSEPELRRIAERWTPHRATAAALLWRSTS